MDEALSKEIRQLRLSEMTDELRERSGTVSSGDPYVTLFYVLLRDSKIPLGELEQFVKDAVVQHENRLDSVFTNGYLANYAKDMIDRLNRCRAASSARVEAVEKTAVWE